MATIRIIILLILSSVTIQAMAQTPQQKYEEFKKEAGMKYISFRDECNKKYAAFLREAWEWYQCSPALPVPEEPLPVPPRPYEDKAPIDNKEKENQIREKKDGKNDEGGNRGQQNKSEGNKQPINAAPKPELPITPIVVAPIENIPQPRPIEPIKEIEQPQDDYFEFRFYGVTGKVRLDDSYRCLVYESTPDAVSTAWLKLGNDEVNNAIRDCLEARIRYNLCDWAYLQYLYRLATEFCCNANSATLLTAYLFCQSGYQMRLAEDNGRIVLMYGSHHKIYNQPYFVVDDTFFYPFDSVSNSVRISNVVFEGERPLSLSVEHEQLLGDSLSDERTIKSTRYLDAQLGVRVPLETIEFFNHYPTSMIGDNIMTRWAMYANTPLAHKTKETLYPAWKKVIDSLGERESVERILNWIQTGLVYEYDDKVWGQDRAFFGEESLYYPYCDCEDRAILFSRLVRDLLGLDVALIYYPGHLAAAVAFNEEVQGDKMLIDGREFTVCDPTYIGAPVGKQMPDLDYDKTQAIVLKR